MLIKEENKLREEWTRADENQRQNIVRKFQEKVAERERLESEIEAEKIGYLSKKGSRLSSRSMA